MADPKINSVRVLCGTHAYACIELYGGAAMDIRLAPGRGVAAAREGVRMREAIAQAAEWFDDYARLHRAKLSEDGNMKADTNAERAAYLRAALNEGEK